MTTLDTLGKVVARRARATMALTLTLTLSAAVACSGSSVGSSAGSGSGTGSSSGSGTGTGSGSSPGSASGSGMGSGPGADAGPPDEAGILDAGSIDAAPIAAPNDQWTWVDFPESKCADGSATGLAVNPHAGAQEVLIYLEGGGACSDYATCWGPSPGARNLTGFTAATFATDKEQNYPALSRSPATASPFASMNLVFVPYCTGDMHSGGTMAALAGGDAGTKQTYFWGGRDMDLFLARLVATYGSATRVYLLGTSAGGFGTMLNLAKVAKAFQVGVDVIDDSGPAILSNGGTSNNGVFTAWATSRPTGCAAPCDTFADILAYDLTLQRSFTPAGRYGFLSFEEDTTIAPDFGYSVAAYPGVLSTFVATLPGPPATATYLVNNHQGHVVESDLTLAPDYLPWMAELVSHGATWGNSGHDGG